MKLSQLLNAAILGATFVTANPISGPNQLSAEKRAPPPSDDGSHHSEESQASLYSELTDSSVDADGETIEIKRDPPSEAIAKAVREMVYEALTEAGLEAAIMGGQAPNVLGSTRLGRDVDFAITTNPTNFKKFKDSVSKNSKFILPKSAVVWGSEVVTIIVKNEGRNIRVDLKKAGQGTAGIPKPADFSKHIWKRPGHDVPTLDIEYLMLGKLGSNAQRNQRGEEENDVVDLKFYLDTFGKDIEKLHDKWDKDEVKEFLQHVSDKTKKAEYAKILNGGHTPPPSESESD